MPQADLHVHALMRRSEDDTVAQALSALKTQGLERLWVYAPVLPVDPVEYTRRLAQLPIPHYQGYIGSDVEDSFDSTHAFVASLSDGPRIDVIPMVHTVEPGIIERLDDILATTDVAAVKLVHDPELLGADPHRLEAQHAKILADLADTGIPAIVHLDLRRSERWIRFVLGEFPGLRLTIAHLGYSRSRMGPLLDEFPNLLADVANLAPHIEAQKESYRQFLERYAGRVVFGSDAFLGDLSGILRHTSAIEALRLSAPAEDSLLRGSIALISG